MPHYVLRVEVVNGPSKGQVVVVQDRSTLIVGRLTECGLSFPQDYTVSRQHFQIELHASKGRLIHLSKTGPTLVNGVSVTEVELNSGDVLEFGAGNKVRIILEDAREVIGPTAAVPVRTEPTRSKSPNGFTASMASCGWSFYESTDDQLGFEKLLKILADSRPFSVLLDFRRIGCLAPPELVQPRYLFSWMRPPTRDQFSPILVSLSENPDIMEIIFAGYGKDGMICFGSSLTGDEQAAHWRKAIGVTEDSPGTSMTAYFWPSILNMILTCQSSEQVAPLLRGLDWVFIESPKSPGNWRLFTKADFASELTKAGLVAALPPTPTK